MTTEEIEKAVLQIFYHYGSWVDDEGEYQPTFEEALEKSTAIIRDLLDKKQS